MVSTVFSGPLFVDIVLPFLLIFVIVFAVLQKSKILGEGKKQIDALVALVIGLIVVSVGNYTRIIVKLIPFLAVSLVVLLVFMIIWGMVYPEGKFEIHKYVQYVIGAIAAIAVVIAVLIYSGGWNYISGAFSGNNALISNAVMIFVIIVGVVVVLIGAKKSGS